MASRGANLHAMFLEKVYVARYKRDPAMGTLAAWPKENSRAMMPASAGMIGTRIARRGVGVARRGLLVVRGSGGC